MTDRVLLVTPVADIGGVARHVLDIARAGVPGYEVLVVSPEGALTDQLTSEGLGHISAQFGPSFGLRRSAEVLRSIWRRTDPAVVHTHLSFADLAGVAALPRGFRGRTAVVSTEHGISTGDHRYQSSAAKARVMQWAHATRLRQTDALIAVSHATKKAMQEQWGAREVIVIHNGIDRSGRSDSDEGASVETSVAPVSRSKSGWSSSDEGASVETSVRSPHITTLARLSPEKRLDALIKAFAVVAERLSQAHLSIGGDGPERANLEALVRDLNLTDQVSLPGFVDSAALLANTDVLALTSLSENLPYAVLDAVAHGVGVVSSPVGGVNEIVPLRCLADPSDPEQFAAAVISQAIHPAQRPVLPANWPTVGDMTKRLSEVYRSCD